MKSRLLLPVTLIVASSLVCGGCKTTPPQKTPEVAATTGTKKKTTHSRPTDQYSDAAFQSFITRLRKAVHDHDVTTLAGMMTKDFGYRMDPPGEGAGVFEYWDQNNLWQELELVLDDQFVPKEEYMVAPAEFLTNPTSYTGYRAGIRQENGGWKFAYFVAG